MGGDCSSTTRNLRGGLIIYTDDSCWLWLELGSGDLPDSVGCERLLSDAQTRSSTVAHGRATPSLSLGTVRLGAAWAHAESGGWCVVEATNVHVFVVLAFCR